MLPIYDDITFLELLEKGGRNKPWLIRALINDTYEEYVLKLFSQEAELDHSYTAAEVFGSVLAAEFDLSTPEVALFELNHDNVFSFPPDQQAEIEEKGFGIKFGCKYYRGSLAYSSQIHKDQIKKRVGIDTLFAFDQLINNVDRQHHKPNVLYRDEGVMLIDHELGFRNMKEAQTNIMNSNPGNPLIHGHICFEMLKRANNSSKQAYFQTFEELLRTLDTDILDPFHQQLQDFDVHSGNFGEIKSFLEFAKANHGLFIRVLKSAIS